MAFATRWAGATGASLALACGDVYVPGKSGPILYLDVADIDAVIDAAHLRDFITQLPQGDATLVGERGLKVSGGEKQRIAIARALLKRSPLLIFDEATSALDSHSEQAVMAAIRAASREHTSLVIAHRLSTVVDCDRILVLEQGQLVESGSHTELLAQQGRYAALWTLQQHEEDGIAD